jgi:large subunit ribosomal protein L19
MHPALRHIANSSLKQGLPTFKPGQTLRVHQRIKEGDKQRIQVFEGMVIKLHRGTGVDATFTVRKIVDGVGVERVFPIHSPLIAKIEITKESRTRRSKLYYLRDLSGKSARMKTTMMEGMIFTPHTPAQKTDQVAVAEEVVTEVPATEQAPAVIAEAPATEPTGQEQAAT